MLVRVVPRFLALVVTLCVLGASLVSAPARADTVVYADNDPSALVVWRDQLDPYGAWVTHERYGVVWVPHRATVGAEFAPYVSAGRWALSEEGDWVWVSDYPFGGVVFHYGRWVWTTANGWVWIPGLEYAPAWVVWRVPESGYAYVGWAPAPPSYVWVDGVAVALWYRPVTPYVFCHTHYVFSYGVHRHLVMDRTRIHDIGGHTVRYRHPSGVRRGPTMTEARVAPRDVPRIRHAARPVPHGAVSSSDRHSAAPAPRAAASRHPAQPRPEETARTTERSAPGVVGPTTGASSRAPESAAAPASPVPRVTGAAEPGRAARPADRAARPHPARSRAEPSPVERANPSSPSTTPTGASVTAPRTAEPARPAVARGRASASTTIRPSATRSRGTHAAPAPARRAPAARPSPAPRRSAPVSPRRR